MAGTASATVVLLPIRPQYARPIMNGSKAVEFRKTVFARTPTHVVVYASSPVRKVLGYFEVDEVDVDSIDAIWSRYADVGGIAERDFREYYWGREIGVALAVERVVVLANPVPLKALGIDHPPQSYMYIDDHVLQTLGGLEVSERDVVDTLG